MLSEEEDTENDDRKCKIDLQWEVEKEAKQLGLRLNLLSENFSNLDRSDVELQ